MNKGRELCLGTPSRSALRREQLGHACLADVACPAVGPTKFGAEVDATSANSNNGKPPAGRATSARSQKRQLPNTRPTEFLPSAAAEPTRTSTPVPIREGADRVSSRTG